MIGYPSRRATKEESTMMSFMAEGNETGDFTMAGRLDDVSLLWEKWLEDPWYGPVVESKIFGVSNSQGALSEVASKITKKQAERYVLVENSGTNGQLAFRERSGKLAKCLHEHETADIMGKLHNLHGHFADQITIRRYIGKFYWPTRHRDIFEYCRSCPMCQMTGPLRPTKGLLPVVSIQVGDILAIDYIGPFTPVAKSGARYIGICVECFTRFGFADAVANATAANSVKILENQVVDKIGYPRSVYNDNGTHFKQHFSAHLKEKGVTQYFAPISHPQSVGLAERYVQVVLNIFRAILQHHPELILYWDELLQTVIRAMNTRYIKTFGFSPAELLLGFNPVYVKGVDEYENIIRSAAISTRIDELMKGEGFSVEEAAYKARLSALDELRDRSVKARFERGETTARSTAAKIRTLEEKVIKKGCLVLLRRLAQDKSHSHKLEAKWEGPYRVKKMAEHGQSAYIEDMHSGVTKGRYHVNALKMFMTGEQVGRQNEHWRSVADINRQIKKTVLQQPPQSQPMQNQQELPQQLQQTHHEEPDPFWERKKVNLHDLILRRQKC